MLPSLFGCCLKCITVRNAGVEKTSEAEKKRVR